MSCSVTGYIQPSLKQLYSALEREYNQAPGTYSSTPDLSYLAEQGVLLLNAALTTEKK